MANTIAKATMRDWPKDKIMNPELQPNLDYFADALADEYERLFANDPEYAYSAAHISPEALAVKMTVGLNCGSANKDGKAIRNACTRFGIPYTYKAIRAFLGTL